MSAVAVAGKPVLLVHPGPVPVAALLEMLQGRLPQLSARVWPDVGNPADVTYALVSRVPDGELAKLPSLKMIGSLHAGIDHLLNDRTLPAGVPLTRPVPTGGDLLMNEFVLTQVLRHHRDMPAYAAAQANHTWKKLPMKPMASRKVGMLGMGAMGASAAEFLARVGFDVTGWARRPRAAGAAGAAGAVPVLAGDAGLKELLARSEILVNLLPLTPETGNLINAAFLAQLPKGAAFINVGRGEHLVEKDLIGALIAGHLSGATLDVFREEPLPAHSPLWAHPLITVTPHAARTVDIASVVAQFAEEVGRVEAGLPPAHAVNRALGY